MAVSSEKTPLVPQPPTNHDLPKVRLRRFHSAPIESFASAGMDMNSLRLSYAAELVLAAVEARGVESAVDLFLGLKGDRDFYSVNPLTYPRYRIFMVCVILGHLILALWEGGARPFPLNPVVAALEAFAFLSYAGHVLFNLWTFGVKQFRDKKWHLAFTVISTAHSLLLGFAMICARWQPWARDADNAENPREWWGVPRLALLAAHALRPVMLISQLRTTRRVFTNVLRTISRTGSFLALWAVVLAFYSVLGTNLFNSEQVTGYSALGDNFDSFPGAVLSLFVLTTEENFPMVADPAFSQRPLVAFPFFISFLLLYIVVILPLLLGIVLDGYAHQHDIQVDRCRRKARNALLAAYYVLDEDGSMGLSREQLVGVLTAEAGVGVNRRQAEQLWRTLVPDDDDDDSSTTRRAIIFSRSRSSPPAATITPSTARETHKREVGLGGRVNVRGFLRLSDLLHENIALVADSEEGHPYDRGGHSPGVPDRDDESEDHWTMDSNQRKSLPRDHADGASSWGGASGDDAESGRTGSEVSMRIGGSQVGLENEGIGASMRCCLSVTVRERLRRCVSGRWFSNVEGAARWAVQRPWFPRASQAITVFLALLALTWTPMSQEWHDLCLDGGQEATTTSRPNTFVCRREYAFSLMDGLALLAFSAEMTAKVLAIGWWQLWQRSWSARFDLIVLLASLAGYLVVGVPGNRLALYVDLHPGLSDVFEVPRALVVLRLLTVFPALRRLLETIFTVSVMVVRMMVLYLCVSYSFAAIGMAIFADSKSDLLAARYSFSTLPEALLALFFLTVTNNWNDLLYPLVNSVSAGGWSALYFVTYMLFCSTVVLDVLVGVVIEGFRVSARGPDTPRVTPDETVIHERKSPTTSVEGCDNQDAATSTAGNGRGPPPRRGVSYRNAGERRYKEVKAEDMFRSAPKDTQELTAKDTQELEEAVKAVEERLHQAWVKHFRSLRIGEDPE